LLYKKLNFTFSISERIYSRTYLSRGLSFLFGEESTRDASLYTMNRSLFYYTLSFIISVTVLYSRNVYLSEAKHTSYVKFIEQSTKIRQRIQDAQASGTFECLSGKSISLQQVNDNYCDCPNDGSDEFLTAACSPVGFFECKRSSQINKIDQEGILPFIQSSRVNDMVCDCCDGSDETQKVCPNSCDVKIAEYRQLLLQQGEMHVEVVISIQ
jgi:hypothetical protein